MAAKRGTPAQPLQPPQGLPLQRRAARLDPEAQSLLRAINAMQPRLGTAQPQLRKMRGRWLLLARLLGRQVAVARVEDRRIEGPGGPLRLRIFRPQQSLRDGAGPAPVLLWFHGGGFVLGGIATADSICRNLAARSGAVVVTAQYRLAPEHAVLAGREDSLAVLDWLVANADALGIDATRMAVGGDSAGGNLAAVLAQRAATRGLPALRLQLLVYPATNLRDRPASHAENAQGYFLTGESIDWFESLIASNEGFDPSDPLVSPALATDLRALPPALVVSTGYDPIRDDGLTYTGQLREAGVPVQLLHYGGQFHGFINFDAVLRAARDALDRMGDGLAHALSGELPETMPDRTCEIGAEGAPPAWTSQRLRDYFVGGLMWGEWLERSRNGLVGASGGTVMLNPATFARTQWAEAFARLSVRETWVREPNA